jgi:hypothetical protein
MRTVMHAAGRIIEVCKMFYARGSAQEPLVVTGVTGGNNVVQDGDMGGTGQLFCNFRLNTAALGSAPIVINIGYLSSGDRGS